MEITNKTHGLPQQELLIDTGSQSLLLNMTKWTKLLAIVAFVMLGLVLLIAGYKGIKDAFGEKETLELLFRMLFFLPALYLFRFSNKMENAINTQNQELMIASLTDLKSFFKFLGVVTLIICVFGTMGILVSDSGLSFLK